MAKDCQVLSTTVNLTVEFGIIDNFPSRGPSSAKLGRSAVRSFMKRSISWSGRSSVSGSSIAIGVNYEETGKPIGKRTNSAKRCASRPAGFSRLAFLCWWTS